MSLQLSVALSLLSPLCSLAIAGPQVPAGADWYSAGNQAGAGCGSSVAGAGDVDGDGFDDVLVGARGFDVSGAGSNHGRVQLFRGSASGLPAAAAWTLTGANPGDELGVSVAGAGDVDGDGFDDVLVYANVNAGASPNRGLVQLFLGSASGLAAAPAWVVGGSAANTFLGFALAGAADVDGDGFDDVVLGAPGASAFQGAAFLYRGRPGGLESSPAWSFFGTPTSRLGGAVAGVRDIDHDGYDDVLVGAQYYDAPGQASNDDRGVAYLFRGSPLGLAATPDWFAEGSQAGEGFGNCVASAGDVEDDGYFDVAIAAQRYDAPGMSNAGRVDVYRGSPYGLGAAPAWSAQGPSPFAQFGAWVAGIGRHDTDAYDDLAIGARYYASGHADEGAVFVYGGSSNGLSASASAAYEANQVSAELGYPVASAGDVDGDCDVELLAGAAKYDEPQADEGVALAYYGFGPPYQTCTLEVISGGLSQDCQGGWHGFSVRNTSPCEPMAWSASSSCAGVTLTPPGGVLEPSGWALVAIGANCNAFPCWYNSCPIDVVAPGCANGSVQLHATIINDPEPCEPGLSATAITLDCTSGPTSELVTLYNTAPSCAWDYVWTAISSCPHVTVTPASGSIAGASSQDVIVSVDCAHAACGETACQVVFDSSPSVWCQGGWEVLDVTVRSIPVNYCTAKQSSLGCLPAIGWNGNPSASSGGPFFVTCTDVISQKTGLFFYGVDGRNAAPFQGGTLCVHAPLRRSPLLFSGGSSGGNDCSGDFSYDFGARIASGVDPSLAAGVHVTGQYWYRDPQASFTTGLSNALELVICD